LPYSPALPRPTPRAAWPSVKDLEAKTTARRSSSFPAGSDGQRLGRALKGLLDIKDVADYGAVYVVAKEAKEAARSARTLLDEAERLFQRNS
jgi:hypothetical protein